MRLLSEIIIIAKLLAPPFLGETLEEKAVRTNFRVALLSLLLSIVGTVRRARSGAVVSRSHEYKAQYPFEGLEHKFWIVGQVTQ